MAILVDQAIWPWRDRLWAHLVSDRSEAELHDFAGRLGLPRQEFQGDHYDIHEQGRAAAIAQGATPVSGRELIRALQSSGLRRPHRRGRPARA